MKYIILCVSRRVASGSSNPRKYRSSRLTRTARAAVILGAAAERFDRRSAGTLPGSNTTTSTSSNPPSAASILGRTSAQLSLPKSLPSAGIAIERMPRARISPARDARPASMSSMRLWARQWRLVGKLIMKRGDAKRPPASKTNILPGFTSPRSQAFLYARKLAGNFFLNWSAMPRPITPTQLTLFTSASTSSEKMSPFL